MLYINSTSQETMKTIVDTYKLPVEAPAEISNISALATFVFESCVHLIPLDIRDFFNVSSENSIFKSELTLHIIINAYMAHLIETEGNIIRTGSLFSRVFDFFGLALIKEKPVNNLFGDKNIPRVAKEHFKKLAGHWMLPSSDDSHAIPAFATPLIAFQAVHGDSHKVISDYTDSQHRWNYMKQNKDIGENLHLHFYDNFKYLLDHFPNIDKIERLFEGNRLSYHPTLNKILFERDYYLGLASKIEMLTMHYSDHAKNQYYQYLSKVALLPNINGRLYYLTSILTGSHDPYIKNDHNIEILTEDEHLIRIKKISSSLIGMAVITIPVMEVYFLYLLKQKNLSFKDHTMRNVMEEYGRNKFIDERVKPLIIPGVKTNILGARMSGEWELAELPYEGIRDILNLLNKVSVLHKTTLSNIFMQPYQYLDNNGYDKYDQMVLSDCQMVDAISGVIEVNHFK
ncbi:hypothetical protein M3194_29825 [Paenibacillus glycanilyticus]|uniref:hypothetical protein n=1 Tax=Paenibacillus glycanilyticus TaxID=126569 RepID=UPI00203B3F80|nr:hypothetical protein [Paenibacillus glycanilyticus]MCM3631499.1 hypothetical protein [Paenibacillus glycanilyticus]